MAAKPIHVDIFVEDRAHEDFMVALVERTADGLNKAVEIRVRSARGGHGRTLNELEIYQKSILEGIAGLSVPDVLVISIDANCSPYTKMRKIISRVIDTALKGNAVIACPDPHIERWYLADAVSFRGIVGPLRPLGRRKCERDFYKEILSRAVAGGGHVPILGGIEFARELAQSMNLFRAGKSERSLKAFVSDLRALLKRL